MIHSVRLKKIYVLVFVTSTLFFFNNCAPVNDDSVVSSEEIAVNCKLVFKPVFLGTYYGFARANECTTCHGAGVSHQFAIDDQDAAFLNFELAGDAEAPEGPILSAKGRFRNNAIIEPGHKSVGKAAHIPEMDSFEANWDAAEAEYNDCIGNSL